jgi:hypothetical protein
MVAPAVVDIAAFVATIAKDMSALSDDDRCLPHYWDLLRKTVGLMG